MLNRYLCLILLLFLFNRSAAQDERRDSVDAARLLTEAKSLFLADKPAALVKTLDGLEHARRAGEKTLEGNLDNLAGVIYIYEAQYDSALSYLDQALAIAMATKDKVLTAKIYNNFGLCYMQSGRQLQAISVLLKAAKLAEAAGNMALNAGTYANISNSYVNLKMPGKALIYADSALKYFKVTKQLSGEANIYNTYGVIYSDRKQYAKALSYYQRSLQIKQAIDDKNGQANAMVNIGALYADLKNYALAKVNYNSAEKLFREVNDPKGLAEVKENRANLKVLQHDTTAVQSSEEAYRFAQSHTTLEQQRDIAYDLAGKYQDKHDLANSLKYFRIYERLKDSTLSEGMLKQVNTLEARFQNEKKQQQISLLNKQNTIKQLQIDKRNSTIRIIAVVFLLALLSAWLFYTRNRVRQEVRLQNAVMHQQTLAAKGIIEAEERERKRIAGDLHDGVGQLFTTVKMNMEILVSRYLLKQPEAGVLAEKTMAMVDESCNEVRSIAHQLMPNALLKSGLVSALRDFINKIPSEKLKIAVETEGLNNRLDSNVETVLYRVIQESVNNVIKHADATLLDILLLCDDREITVTVEDNGKGFDQKESNTAGIGLKNMISRIEYLKGSVDVSSTPGKGTLVAIHIPFTA